MVKIADTIKGKEIGMKSSNRYIWTICPDCNEGRWVRLRKNQSIYIRCRSCARTGKRNHNFGKFGKNSPRWIDGKRKDGQGYIRVLVSKTSPFAKMRGSSKYVREHRLVMAEHLGRCLESWEKVHHINMDNTDNRIENLYIYRDNSKHQKGHASLYKIVENLLKRNIIKFREGEYSEKL